MPAGDVAKVDAYLAGLEPEPRAALERLRNQIRRAAPKAEEGFGYGLPGFYLDGPLFYYGAGKSHLALYGDRPEGFDSGLDGHAMTKGAVRFTADKPLPAAWVTRIVKAKAKANRARASAKGH